MGMDVFRKIPKNARLIVAEAVWQYSHHVLAGLRDHEGPILVLANWSGEVRTIQFSNTLVAWSCWRTKLGRFTHQNGQVLQHTLVGNLYRFFLQ
jgi:hypothetical protein